MKETLFCIVIFVLGALPFCCFGAILGVPATYFLRGALIGQLKTYIFVSASLAVGSLLVLLAYSYFEERRHRKLLAS